MLLERPCGLLPCWLGKIAVALSVSNRGHTQTVAQALIAMNPALELTRLPTPVQRILSPDAPVPMRMGAARGLVPGLKPGDLVAVVAALSESEDQGIASTALNTLKTLPPPVLSGALTADLEPGPLDIFARVNGGKDEILSKLAVMPRVTNETLCHLAATGSEALTELLATNEARLLTAPEVIEKLYFNKNTRMSTADRLIELAYRNGVEVQGIPAFKELGEVLQNELIPAPDDEPSPDDLVFREADGVGHELDEHARQKGDDYLEDFEHPDDEASQVEDGSAAAALLAAADASKIEKKKAIEKKKEETGALHSRIAEMTISQKIRMATIGPGAARALLLRDTNKLVAGAAIRSPMVQEQDVERISKMRTVHEEVLRTIATKGEWVENHTIKFNLVANPRTPISYSSKFLNHLRDDELKRLEKNRDVTAPVRALAKQHLQRKAKKAGNK